MKFMKISIFDGHQNRYELLMLILKKLEDNEIELSMMS